MSEFHEVDVWYFTKHIFPRGNFPRVSSQVATGNFSSVQFPKRRLLLSVLAAVETSQIWNFLSGNSEGLTYLLGNCKFWKLPLGKLSLGKSLFGKCLCKNTWHKVETQLFFNLKYEALPWNLVLLRHRVFPINVTYSTLSWEHFHCSIGFPNQNWRQKFLGVYVLWSDTQTDAEHWNCLFIFVTLNRYT